MESVNLNQILYGSIQRAIAIEKQIVKDGASLAGFYLGTLQRDEILKRKINTLSPAEREARNEHIELLKQLNEQNGLKVYNIKNGDPIDEVAGKLVDLLNNMEKNET